MLSPRVIISGGGTGGHIFPAIAIANGIKEKYPKAEILFVGAKGRMEMEKVPEAGYEIIGLWISGLQRKLTIDNLSFPFKVISSLTKSRRIIKKFKPDIAIGVGGYASGPLLKAAGMLGIKTLLQEQNSYPGITNKLLAAKANKICVAYHHMEQWFPKESIVFTGNPIRKEVVEISGKKERSLKFFGLNPQQKVVLVIGGSLGARTINESIVAMLPRFLEEGVQLLWQTGKSFANEAEIATTQLQYDGIKHHTFIKAMDLAYAAADVIISRAGAMSISELCLVKKPTILIPSPNVSEDHQTKNAMALVSKGAAMIVKDNEARSLLETKLFDLINDDETKSKLITSITPMGKRNATEDIVRQVGILLGE